MLQRWVFSVETFWLLMGYRNVASLNDNTFSIETILHVETRNRILVAWDFVNNSHFRAENLVVIFYWYFYIIKILKINLNNLAWNFNYDLLYCISKSIHSIFICWISKCLLMTVIFMALKPCYDVMPENPMLIFYCIHIASHGRRLKYLLK